MKTIASKVAQVNLVFWIMKICATTLGETAGDLLSMTLGIGYAQSTILLLGLFLASLVGQLRANAYHPLLYWLVIVTTSTAGTTLSDFMDRTLGLGYAAGATILASTLLCVLGVWYASERSLKVDNIRKPRVELFYWSAILVSNTLGTALGDYIADDSGLGFLGGASLVGGLIAATAVARYITPVNRVSLFWVAFVLTRPFGAMFGDLLTKAPAAGGLGFGTVGSSLVLASILGILLAQATWRLRRHGVMLDRA